MTVELGVITIEGDLQDPADPSWFLGPHKCGVIFYRCPTPGHDHLNVIRVSETNPVSNFEGDKYKNIWKMERISGDKVSISPSILEEDHFHSGIPTYFNLVSKEQIYRDTEWLVRFAGGYRSFEPAEILGIEMFTPENYEPRACYRYTIQRWRRGYGAIIARRRI